MRSSWNDLWHHRWIFFCSSWIGYHSCKVLPRSVQSFVEEDFWRFFYVKSNMAAEPHDWWCQQIFSPFNLARDDPQNFSYQIDKAFNVCNYDIIMKPLMPLSKKHYVRMDGCMYVWMDIRTTRKHKATSDFVSGGIKRTNIVKTRTQSWQ